MIIGFSFYFGYSVDPILKYEFIDMDKNIKLMIRFRLSTIPQLKLDIGVILQVTNSGFQVVGRSKVYIQNSSCSYGEMKKVFEYVDKNNLELTRNFHNSFSQWKYVNFEKIVDWFMQYFSKILNKDIKYEYEIKTDAIR